jgi:putative membrane protein
MPSDGAHRLHPSSILFGVLRHLRHFVLPLAALVFAARDSWELWGLVALGPYAVAHVVRYLTLRYHFDEQEFVLRGGVLFKSERHVPYARIQSVDVEQGPLHRILGVYDVALQTGGGAEPEARLRVIGGEALAELRTRVDSALQYGAAPHAAPHGAPNVAPPAPTDGATSGATTEATTAAILGAAPHRTAPSRNAPATLLALRPRDLALAGLLEGRGMLVFGALLGIVWEIDALGGRVEDLIARWTGTELSIRSILGRVFGAADEGPLVLAQSIGAGLLAFAGLLAVLRLGSMLWFMARMWNFRLVRVGRELRSEFGLFTRVSATIPLGRVQSVTVIESPLQRRFERVSVRVETAGGTVAQDGDEQKKSTGREWIAPILPRANAGPLIAELFPELDGGNIAWSHVHPRGPARAARAAFGFMLLATGWTAFAVSPWLALPSLALAAWAGFAAHRRTSRLAYGLSSGSVAQRRGWLWKSTTFARLSKIQVAALLESPFDRRRHMARVRVDTAGTSDANHAIDVPYLARERAAELRATLAQHAARTTYRT